jgi:hypothetical protein
LSFIICHSSDQTADQETIQRELYLAQAEVFSTPINPLSGQQLRHRLHKRNSIPEKDREFPPNQRIQTSSMVNPDSDPTTIDGLLPR